MNLIKILHLHYQYYSLNNNQLSKEELFKFNANSEELYCNEFDKDFVPSSPILLTE